MKKFIVFLLTLLLSVSSMAAFNGTASATNPDQCDQEFTYRVTPQNDGNGNTVTGPLNDNRLDVSFINTNSSGNPDSVNVSADSGYQLVSVELSVSDDNQNGYVDYSANFPGQFNPSGTTINEVKVKVKKVCDKVNICHQTSSQQNPWEAIRVNDDAFDGQGQNDHTQHGDFLYNGPVNAQNQQPLKPEGDVWCEENGPNAPTETPVPTEEPTATPTPEVTEDPTPTPETECTQDCGNTDTEPTPTPEVTEAPRVTEEPTATPTNVPSNNSQGGDGLSDGLSDGRSSGTVQGAVLGASTMASTGGFVNGIMNASLVLGLISLALGVVSRSKENRV